MYFVLLFVVFFFLSLFSMSIIFFYSIKNLSLPYWFSCCALLSILFLLSNSQSSFLSSKKFSWTNIKQKHSPISSKAFTHFFHPLSPASGHHQSVLCMYKLSICVYKWYIYVHIYSTYKRDHTLFIFFWLISLSIMPLRTYVFIYANDFIFFFSSSGYFCCLTISLFSFCVPSGCYFNRNNYPFLPSRGHRGYVRSECIHCLWH